MLNFCLVQLYSGTGKLIQEIACGLSNGSNTNDLEWPWRSLLM